MKHGEWWTCIVIIRQQCQLVDAEELRKEHAALACPSTVSECAQSNNQTNNLTGSKRNLCTVSQASETLRWKNQSTVPKPFPPDLSRPLPTVPDREKRMRIVRLEWFKKGDCDTLVSIYLWNLPESWEGLITENDWISNPTFLWRWPYMQHFPISWQKLSSWGIGVHLLNHAIKGLQKVGCAWFRSHEKSWKAYNCSCSRFIQEIGWNQSRSQFSSFFG